MDPLEIFKDLSLPKQIETLRISASGPADRTSPFQLKQGCEVRRRYYRFMDKDSYPDNFAIDDCPDKLRGLKSSLKFLTDPHFNHYQPPSTVKSHHSQPCLIGILKTLFGMSIKSSVLLPFCLPYCATVIQTDIPFSILTR